MPTLRLIDDEEVIEPVSQTLCEICQKQFSNYVCPRCNLRYCSLVCYKDLKHADCTESFYKDSVTAEIQSRDLDKNSKNKMMEMLRRLQEENNNDDGLHEEEEEEEDNLLSRFEHLDIDNADVNTIWELLSEKEREEFEAAISKGNLEDFDLPIFQPWWSHIKNIIQDMDLPQHQQQENDIPGLPEPLLDFEKMTKPQARDNPQLLWNMLNILLTYSYLIRHTMGDLVDDAEDTLNLTSILSANVLYSTTAGCAFSNVSDVVADTVQQISNVDKQHTKHYDLKLLLLEDLKALTVDDYHIRALSDFYHTLNQIQQDRKKKRKSLLLAVRKLYFYLAAACYLDQQRLSTLHFAIDAEYTKVTLQKEEFEREYDAAQSAIEKQKKNNNRIQEL